MNPRLPCLVVGLALAASSATSGQSVSDLRSSRIGDSSWIRLDWTAQDAGEEGYEIWRQVRKSNQAVRKELVGRTSSSRPDSRVFVDQSAKEKGVSYFYTVRGLHASEESEPRKVELTSIPSSRLIRFEDFDAGRLMEPFEPREIRLESGATSAWAVRDGRLDWLHVPKLSDSSRIFLDADGSATQVTARIALLESSDVADRKDAKVGIGIASADGLRVYSIVVRERQSGEFKVSLFDEDFTAGDAPDQRASVEVQEDPSGVDLVVASPPVRWIWLKLAITGDGKLLGKSWMDSESEDPSKWQLVDEATNLTGWSRGRAVLIGGGRGMRAGFGEVYVEQHGTPVPAAETQPAAPASPAAPARTELASTDDEKCKIPLGTAFQDLPTVIRLVRRGSLRPDESTDSDHEEFRYLEQCDTSARPFDFAKPARFAVPRFDASGCEFEDEGAVIYEGMRFVVAPSGAYELRFVVSTPAMPVTLRLQLHVPCWDGTEHTVTIPAIDLPPHANARGQFEPAVWKVRHIGVSQVLVRPEPRLGESLGIWAMRTLVNRTRSSFSQHFPQEVYDGPYAIRRTGTARFGSYPLVAY